MILIKNGIICDGTGGKPYKADVLTDGDKIIRIGQIEVLPEYEIIDARGKFVTPGFIDAHRHCDLAALYDAEFGKAELFQGITTVVGGNCGLSPVPTSKEILDYIEPCLGTADCNFPKVSNYISMLKSRKLPINMGILAATGTISAATKGYGSRPFTPQQLENACELIEDAMEAGALGLSCGIMYDPECYTSEDEFVAMAEAAAKHGGYLTSHIRGEGNSLVKSVKEVIRIAEKAGIPLNISHFKVTGIRNWGQGIDEAIELLNHVGNVTCDAYPYTGGSTTVMSLLPPTVKDFSDMDFLKHEIDREHDDWDNMVSSIGWENIIISSAIYDGHKKYCGKNFADAAVLAEKPPHELMAEMIEKNSGKVGVILMSMAEADVNKVLQLPYSTVISDSLYGGGDMPHPRLYGSFPRVIRKCVNEDKLFPIETAIKKMTSMPAKRLGLTDRGTISDGMKADIIVFDSEKIRDNASFENPRQFSTGIEYMLINGAEVIKNSQLISMDSGCFISKKR